MEDYKRKGLARKGGEQGENHNLNDNKAIHRMSQEIILKRLANYQEDNTLVKKINKFFSIFF